MRPTRIFIMLLLMTMGVVGMKAQVAVTVGDQVTDVNNIVSGKAYLLRWDALTGTPYVLDTGTDYYGMANNNSATQAAVYYLIKDGDTWYIENAYTGMYWPTPTSNDQAMAPTTAANAGTWTIAASATANRFTFTCNVGGTAYHTNRSNSKLVAHTSDSPVSIYEVSASNLSTNAYSNLAGMDVNVSSTEAANLSEGQWYVMFDRGAYHGYLYENTSSHTLYNTNTVPNGSTSLTAKYLVRLLNAGNGKYYIQTGFCNYFGSITQSTAVPVTSIASNAITIGKIANTDGHFYLLSAAGVVLDANNTYSGDATVVGYGTTVPTTTGGNNDWAFYPVELVESWSPTASEVYTINNTNAYRGALIYNTENPKYVWSSGKSGTFDASNANSQWVIYPTGTEGQFYLYNVGAGKFAIPTGIAQSASNSWMFSDNAVAVIFENQNDGTKKIKMASNPISGTNAAYMAVSNNYTGPIINYNDEGGNFTITKVDGADASTAVNAAVAKLVKNQTALTTYPQTSGWYVIQIKNKTGAASYAGRYLQPSTTLYNNLYPLSFTGAIDVQPSIADATFFTHINCTSWDVNTWQLPDGRFLVDNGSGKFPTPSATAGNVICGFDNGNYFKSNNNWFADPYNSDANYFFGETTYMRTSYIVYPIDLSAAGLTAWQMICDAAPETQDITCTRNDVSGLTSVYKNGYIFLPSSVTPTASEFNLDGATNIEVDAANHTVTFTYNPDLAIVEGGVIVEQGWQTAGRDGEVMLLRVTAAPFKDATNTTMTVSLKDGSEANISTLKLYEANSSSPEIYSTGDGAPTKTEVATATISGSTATFTIGNLAAGTHYYWIGATVKGEATLGAIIDAAVTGITYTRNNNVTNLDLTFVGNPSDRGAMVFNTQSYPYLPRDNGSRVYRIPAMVVADDGSIVVACDKRYDSHTDIGGGHVIDIVVRRSTDGGKTWSEPVVIAKGNPSNDATCGYGDPSLYKGKDGKIYCLYAAGNTGYFYGLNRVCVSVSTDNGATWDTANTSPTDLTAQGRLTDHATSYGSNTCYGLFDYFVTSGRGLCTSEGYLMALLPAEAYTTSEKSSSAKNGNHDYIFYSTDQGATWHVSESAIFVGGDEAKVIQANDGSLIASVRQGYNRGFNTATYTANGDGTLTFTMGSQWNNSQLNAGGYANNQDIFYYQRETVTSKTDVIIHSMTTGQHANLKLYYSTDQGRNWTEFLNVQTKGTRYVTMERSGSEENPGSLYLFFEDQSLNSAGGYTDYNHYPLNFLEITRDQLVSLIPALDEYNVPEYLKTSVVKNSVYQTGTGCDTYGAFSGTGSGHWARTWTSNASSGVAGLTVSTESGYGFDKATILETRVMTIRPSANGATDTYTITAPAGYVISSYSIGGAVYTGGTYRITAADGTTTGDITSTTTPTHITVNDVNAASTTFTFYGASQSNWFGFTNFTITLTKPLALNVVGDKSYATLYVPFNVKTDADTKAYYIAKVADGVATLTELSGGNIPAKTAVVLINDNAATTTTLNIMSNVEPVKEENLLKGTLVPMSLDLGDTTPYYSMGRKDGKIGFYKFNNNGTTTITLGANKAYLDTGSTTSSKGFTFSFGDPSGIDQAGTDVSVQMSDVIYNLSGQRVNRLTKGLYIVNGKKVVIK